MAQCSKCGETFEGDDCLLCKTSAGISLQQLAGGLIITSSVEPGEESPVNLENMTDNQVVPIPVPMCRVGRDTQNDVVVTGDNGISRNQFVITYEDGYFYLMDLGSRNGTMLNGRSLTERTIINDGDQIQAGGLRLKFTVDAEMLVRSGQSDFIRYLESKQASGSQGSDEFLPSMTVDVVLPDEARAALEKAFYAQQRESGNVDDEAETVEAAEDKKSEELHEKVLTEDTSVEEKLSNGTHEEGAEQEMTVQEEAASKSTDWCPKYMQDELSRMEKEIQDLNDVMQEAKRKIQDCESRIKIMRSLQKSLLTATGDELVEACTRVLQLMGWRVKRGEKDKQELVLSSESSGMVITRVAWTNPQAAHVDLGTLVISQVYHWCKQKTEPKGILIVNTLASGGSQDGSFGADLAEYARQKNVCVMSTLQLLYMFRELNQDMEHADVFKQTILSTSGVMAGYGAEASEPAVAA